VGEGGSDNKTPATYEQTTGSGGGSPTAAQGWTKQSIWSAWERIKEVEPTTWAELGGCLGIPRNTQLFPQTIMYI